MPKKICNFGVCHKIINGNEKYCEEHKKESDVNVKEKHKHYKRMRIDQREQSFYNSKQWIMLRDFIAVKYKGLCLWSYCIEDSIVSADTYHHIIPVKDDWNERLDIYNIIPLSNRAHNMIHEMYKKDKESTQKVLKELIFKWNELNGVK